MSVREEVAKIDGVESIDVSAKTGLLTIASSAPLDVDAVIAAVDEAGYQVVRG